MKKIVIALVILTITVSAQYEIFKSQSGDLSGSQKVVFFGKYKDFSSQLKQGSNQALRGALLGGVSGGLSSGGINMIVGFLDPFIMDLHADQRYLKVIKYIGSNGKVGFKKLLFVGDKHPSYSEKQIDKILK